jgi:D-alanine transaminase
MDTVFLNHQYVKHSDAKISLFDRGFLFADGIYEVIPVYQGTTVFLDEHLDRLAKSVEYLGIPYTVDKPTWRTICNTLIHHNGADRPIYIQITAGTDHKRQHARDKTLPPTEIAFSLDPIALGNGLRSHGVKAITHPDIRWEYCHIKAIALLGHILLHEQALAQDAVEAILIRDGFVTEGTSSNVFMVSRENHQDIVITPPLDHSLLPGITRLIAAEVCKKRGIHFQERPIDEKQLETASEIWISNSTREIRPVIQLNDTRVHNGKPGPVWKTIAQGYVDHIQNILSA